MQEVERYCPEKPWDQFIQSFFPSYLALKLRILGNYERRLLHNISQKHPQQINKLDLSGNHLSKLGIVDLHANDFELLVSFPMPSL